MELCGTGVEYCISATTPYLLHMFMGFVDSKKNLNFTSLIL